jgi:hypothetical protein
MMTFSMGAAVTFFPDWTTNRGWNRFHSTRLDGPVFFTGMAWITGIKRGAAGYPVHRVDPLIR